MKMKKRYGAIFATLFLCIAMHAQDFQPMEYNGLLYQELECNVADKEDIPLISPGFRCMSQWALRSGAMRR